MLTLFRTKMSQKRKTKEEIVAEYLTGNYTYRGLGLKYDIPFRSICDWVLEYQGRKPTWREKMKRKREKETGMNLATIAEKTENQGKLLKKNSNQSFLQTYRLRKLTRPKPCRAGVQFHAIHPRQRLYGLFYHPIVINAFHLPVKAAHAFVGYAAGNYVGKGT